MEKKDAKYKFDTNLIKASHSKDLETAKKEWKIIFTEKRDEIDGLCICQRKVKYVTYMYNIETQNTIIVGTKCREKFNMGEENIKNKILTQILRNNLEKGEYVNIDNILEYCKSVEEQLLKYIQDEFNVMLNQYTESEKYWEDMVKGECYIPKSLIELLINTSELVEKYKLEYLGNVRSLIDNKIKEIEIRNSKNKKIKPLNIIREYPLKKSMNEYNFRYQSDFFEDYKKIIQLPDIYEKYKKWKSGKNYNTNRKVNIGGEKHKLLGEIFRCGGILGGVPFKKLEGINMEEYIEESEKIKNEIEEYNTSIDNIIIEINISGG